MSNYDHDHYRNTNTHTHTYIYIYIYIYIRKCKEIPKSFNNKTSLINKAKIRRFVFTTTYSCMCFKNY